MVVTNSSKRGGETGNVSPPRSAAPNTDNVAPAADDEFSAFYRKNVPTLVAYIMTQGANIVDAADIVQDTMALAYRQWDEIQNPRAWSYRVAHRALIKRFSSPEYLVSDMSEHENSLLIESNVDEFDRRIQEQDLIKLLGALSQRQRQVLALSISGLSPTEIADILSMSSTSVRSTLRKARMAAKEYLEKNWKRPLGKSLQDSD